MRQAIEEGFILDVLKNYTNYKVMYQLAQKIEAADEEVDSKKAAVKLNQWVRLHDHNISQKVKGTLLQCFEGRVQKLTEIASQGMLGAIPSDQKRQQNSLPSRRRSIWLR